MQNQERMTDFQVRPVDSTPITGKLVNVLKTTPGSYYFDNTGQSVRAEILEKIDQMSKGKY